MAPKWGQGESEGVRDVDTVKRGQDQLTEGPVMSKNWESKLERQEMLISVWIQDCGQAILDTDKVGGNVLRNDCWYREENITSGEEKVKEAAILQTSFISLCKHKDYAQIRMNISECKPGIKSLRNRGEWS